MSPRALPVLLALLAPSLAWAGGTAAVPPIVPKGVDAKVATNLTGLLSSELDFSGAYDTVNEIPAPASLNVGCLAQTSCLAGIAKGAGADAVMVGSVGPGPSGLQVYLVLFEKGAIKSKRTFNVAADNSALADNAGKWIKELVTGQAPAAAAAAEAPAASTFTADEEEDDFEFDAGSSKPSSSKGSTAVKTRIDTSSSTKPRALEDDFGDEDEDDGAAAAAAAKAKADAEARARAEAKARAEAEAKAKAEADARARADAERKAREEAARRAEAERERREEEERLAREEEERVAREEAARRAKAEADSRARAASAAKAAPAAEESDDFEFGSAAGLIAIEGGGDEPEEPSSGYRSSASSSSSRSASSRSYDEDEDTSARPSRDLDEDEDLGLADEDEDEDVLADEDEDEDEDLDLDDDRPAKKATSSSKSSSSASKSTSSSKSSTASKSSSSSSKSGSSSSRDLDGPTRGGSKSSASLDRDEPEKPGIHITGRVGYSNYYAFNFVTYGAELNVPVATSIAVVVGIEGFSTQRHLGDNVVAQLAKEQGVEPGDIESDPWNTILPINAGVVYKYPGKVVRPYGGLDLTATPYTSDFKMAFGGRVRGGSDFMLADNFGLNLNVAVGYMSGSELENTQESVKNSGIIPQISGGTVIEF